MDSWSAIQLKKMQAGGNADLNAFLKRYGIDKHTDPKVKYNTRAAEAFKEKVAAAAEGRPWTCPTDIPMGTAPASAVPRHVGSTNSMSRAGSGASFNTAASGGATIGIGTRAAAAPRVPGRSTRSTTITRALRVRRNFSRVRGR